MTFGALSARNLMLSARARFRMRLWRSGGLAERPPWEPDGPLEGPGSGGAAASCARTTGAGPAAAPAASAPGRYRLRPRLDASTRWPPVTVKVSLLSDWLEVLPTNTLMRPFSTTKRPRLS